MTTGPGLRTSRLLLRRWLPADREPFAAMNADPRVRQHFPTTLSREESDNSVARIEDGFERQGFGWWAVEVIGGASFIGFIGLSAVPFVAHFTPCIETGWRLAADYWNRGYATEGARAALAFGFEQLQLNEIVAFTVPANVRSRHVMDKLGMTHNPADDFDHPSIPEGHPLRRHVLYRIGRTTGAMRRIEVMDYNPEWPRMFADLRDAIWPSVRDLAVGIEHVGSTSVAGLAAKPVLEIDLVIEGRGQMPMIVERLATIGYRHRGDLGIEDREVFAMPRGMPMHHLYVCTSNSLPLRNHLALRDHLRAHPPDATAYGNLKKELARKFPNDIDAYTEGKTEFILGILAKYGFSPASLDSIRRVNLPPTW